jgi:hypothetical protein
MYNWPTTIVLSAGQVKLDRHPASGAHRPDLVCPASQWSSQRSASSQTPGQAKTSTIHTAEQAGRQQQTQGH